MCHRGQCGAGWGFPDVTDEEEKLPGKPFLLLMCKIRKTTGEQADSGVRTLHREQTNHDQLRGPGFITSLSVRDHNKEKGAAQGRLPELEAKQRTKKCQPIQILLCAPRTSVIRMDFLDLTIANAGVTLYLDKDWYSDLYENRDTSIRMVFCFNHG